MCVVRGREIVLRAHNSALRRLELDRHARVVVIVVVVEKHERNARARGSGTYKKRDKRSADTHTHNTLARENKKKREEIHFWYARNDTHSCLFGQKGTKKRSPLELESALQNKKRSTAHLTCLVLRMCF